MRWKTGSGSIGTVHTVLETSRFDALALVLEGPGLFEVGQDGDSIRDLRVLDGQGPQGGQLLAQHLKLEADVGAISRGQQRGQLGLDLGMLVQQGADGGVRREIGGEAHGWC